MSEEQDVHTVSVDPVNDAIRADAERAAAEEGFP